MSVTRRRLPPFAKNFIQHDPDFPLAWIYCGPNAWKAKEQLNNRTVILPPGENPKDFDWRFLKNQMVICQGLGDVTKEYLQTVAMYVLEDGAEFIDLLMEPRPLVFNGETLRDLTVNYERYYRD